LAIEIREATERDIGDLIELWKEFMDFHRVRDSFFTRRKNGHEMWAVYMKPNIKGDRYLVLIASEDDRPVGYCVATVLSYPPVLRTIEYGFIQDMAVTASHRRMGVGEALFQRAESWLLGKGVTRIEANVLVKNEVSRAFWRKMGFEDYLERLARKYE